MSLLGARKRRSISCDVGPPGRQARVVASGTAIEYREVGSGAPVVFLHDWLCNGRAWDDTARWLGADFRCIVPDWPLGAHDLPCNPEVPLGVATIGELVGSFIEALGLDRVTLVGHGGGGAIAQSVAASSPDWLDRLVLVSSEGLDSCPGATLRRWQRIARVPGAVSALSRSLRSRPVAAWALGPAPPRRPWFIRRSYTKGLRSSAAIRSDVQRLLRGVSPEAGAAIARLSEFFRPVLVVWGTEEKRDDQAAAGRLLAAFPNASAKCMEAAPTALPEEHPRQLAVAIADFITATVDVPGLRPLPRRPGRAPRLASEHRAPTRL